MRHAAKLSCAALILLLAVPATTAVAGSWFIEASAARIEVGPSDLHGQLSIAILEQVAQTEPMLPSDFTLRGDALRLEMDVAEPTATVLGQTSYSPTTNKTVYDFSSFAAHGLQNRASYQFLVVPTAGSRVELRTSCGGLSSSLQESLVRDPKVVPEKDRASIRVDASQAAQWSVCSRDAQLTIAGEFLVCLWQWDFAVESGQGYRTFQTGRLQPQLVAGAPDSTAVASRDQQAFLYVRNGTLTIGLASGSPHELYVASPGRLQTAAGVQLVDASLRVPTLDGQEEFKGKKADVAGALDLEILEAGVGKDLRMAIGGDIAGVNVDGHPVPVGTSVAAPAGGFGWAWVVLAGFMVLLLVAASQAVPAMRRRQARRLLRIAQHLPPQQALRVIDLCSQALERVPRSGLAFFLRARALTAQGELQQAEADCKASWDLLDAEDPLRQTVALQAVAVCQMLRLHESKNEWIGRAVLNRPD